MAITGKKAEMNLNLIPPDSILKDWVGLARFMEAPYSYLLGVGLASISAILRRNCWFELMDTGLIYPTLSVILIGPTGIGKDTSINLAQRRILTEFMPENRIQGITTEGMAWELKQLEDKLGEPATTGYILANEMGALFGNKDYQEGMVKFLTDILSEGKPEYKHGIKTKPFVVHNPTVVLQAGSTEEWFHQLPKDALQGGFIPRCLVVVERAARAHIAIPQDYMDFADRKWRLEALQRVHDGIEKLIALYQSPQEIYMTEEAKDPYVNWYHNRYKLVGPLARGYAHRARGHVAKMAMISAACRGKRLIDLADVNFAMGVMNSLIAVLEQVILPPTDEGRCVAAIRENLPATTGDLVVMLRPKYKAQLITNTLNMLLSTGELKQEKGTWLDNSSISVI